MSNMYEASDRWSTKSDEVNKRASEEFEREASEDERNPLYT